jgi:peptide/nickel transport system ATP-binding protein
MIHDHTLPARIASIDTAPPGPLLTVDDLYIAPAGGGKALVDGVSFALQPGETLGIVGESGSGKSLTCRAILGVLPPGLKIAGGRIGYRGLDLLTLDRRGWAPLRGTRISAVFQDPGSYLNPSVPVGRQLAEALRATMKLSRAAAQTRGLELLRLGRHARCRGGIPAISVRTVGRHAAARSDRDRGFGRTRIADRR